MNNKPLRRWNVDKKRVERRNSVLKSIEAGMGMSDAIKQELMPLNNPKDIARHDFLKRQIKKDVNCVLNKRRREQKKKEAANALKQSSQFKRALADAAGRELYHKTRSQGEG